MLCYDVGIMKRCVDEVGTCGMSHRAVLSGDRITKSGRW